MTTFWILAGAWVALIVLTCIWFRCAARLRERAERDEAAINRVRNMPLPAPGTPGHARLMQRHPSSLSVRDNRELWEQQRRNRSETSGYVPPAPDAGSVAIPMDSLDYTWSAPATDNGFSGGGDFGGGGASGSWDSSSSDSSSSYDSGSSSSYSD